MHLHNIVQVMVEWMAYNGYGTGLNWTKECDFYDSVKEGWRLSTDVENSHSYQLLLRVVIQSTKEPLFASVGTSVNSPPHNPENVRTGTTGKEWSILYASALIMTSFQYPIILPLVLIDEIGIR